MADDQLSAYQQLLRSNDPQDQADLLTMQATGAFDHLHAQLQPDAQPQPTDTTTTTPASTTTSTTYPGSYPAPGVNLGSAAPATPAAPSQPFADAFMRRFGPRAAEDIAGFADPNGNPLTLIPRTLWYGGKLATVDFPMSLAGAATEGGAPPGNPEATRAGDIAENIQAGVQGVRGLYHGARALNALGGAAYEYLPAVRESRRLARDIPAAAERLLGQGNEAVTGARATNEALLNEWPGTVANARMSPNLSQRVRILQASPEPAGPYGTPPNLNRLGNASYVAGNPQGPVTMADVTPGLVEARNLQIAQGSALARFQHAIEAADNAAGNPTRQQELLRVALDDIRNHFPNATLPELDQLEAASRNLRDMRALAASRPAVPSYVQARGRAIKYITGGAGLVGLGKIIGDKLGEFIRASNSGGGAGNYSPE